MVVIVGLKAMIRPSPEPEMEDAATYAAKRLKIGLWLSGALLICPRGDLLWEEI